MKKYFKERLSKELSRQLIKMKEAPEKVALGCALGVIVNFFPTFGIGFIIALLLASLLKVSRPAAVIASLATGGPLIPGMYALNFLVGGAVVGRFADTFEELPSNFYSEYFISRLLKNPSLLSEFLESLGIVFTVGFLINAVLFGTLTYIVVRYFILKSINPQKN